MLELKDIVQRLVKLNKNRHFVKINCLDDRILSRWTVLLPSLKKETFYRGFFLKENLRSTIVYYVKNSNRRLR